ncbi:MAG: alkaline phosphatase [Acidobacteriota bacterium]|nr:alkaline phosphatase [Acidobacteriota bacterium]MDH3523339.1 alkaline phosphatase [Acidobacteriota bacterium]
MTAEEAPSSARLRRRLGTLALKLLGVALALYLLLPLFGLRLTRVVRRPVPLAGSELERSRAAARLGGPAGGPTNLVVFVADGLGFAHLAAARAALHGLGGASAWDRFTAAGWHRAHSDTGFLVDSAASATALATGEPTGIGRVGVDSADAPLRNLVERAAAAGYRTGIVTDSYVWDATPAAFATHAASRDDAASILAQLAGSPLDLLVGELEDVGEGAVPELEPTLEILRSRFRVFGPDPDGGDGFFEEGAGELPVAALFSEDQVTDLESTPTLPRLVAAALARLSSGERPFFLLVESEEPDSASHRRDFERLLRGMAAIEAALTSVLDAAAADGETLVLFTSDHETGGLALDAGDGTNSSLRALWPTDGHTGTVVPVLAYGPGAERFAGIHATWQLGRLLAAAVEAPAGSDEPRPEDGPASW